MFENFNSEKNSRSILTLVIIIFAVALLYMLRGFINAFLGAVIMYVLFRPLMMYLCEKKKWKKGLAAVMMLLLSFLLVVLPVFLICYLVISKLSLFFSDTSMVMQTLNDLDSKIREATGLTLLSAENIQAMQGKGAGYLTEILSQSINMLLDVGVMYFLLYYLLTNYGNWGKWITGFLPVKNERIHVFTAELKAMTFSNVLGAPLLALIQGIFAFIGYWIFGVQEPFFWGLMTGFFSFLPVVGSTMIWLPAAIVQMTSGFMWQGVGIILYGLLVIGVVDNVFRFIFQKKIADVHPIITILGVIAGIPIFGVPGIIFGPLLMSYFILLVKIFQEEYDLPKAHVKTGES